MKKHPIKIPDFEFPKPDARGDRAMLKSIREHGWHVWLIPDEDDQPGFAYTVGVYLRSLQPEVLVMGLPPEPAHGILNRLAEFQIAGGILPIDQPFQIIPEAPPVWLRPIHFGRYRDHLGSAIWLYRALPAAFPALQCFWPDRSGCFPHDEGFDASYKGLQIDLSHDV